MKLAGIKSNRADSFAERCAVNNLLNDVPILADENVGLMRHSKKVVVIAHNLLIRTDEHHRQIVTFALCELMQFENRLYVMQIDKFIYNTVGIAGYIT